MDSPAFFPVAALSGLSSPYSAEARTYFDAAGPLSDPQKALVDSLIRGFIVDGDWPKFSRFWLGGNETDLAGSTCLVTQGVLTKHNATPPGDPVLFEPGAGFSGFDGGSGDISASYQLTDFNPSLDAKFLIDSCHMGAYVTGSRTASAGRSVTGGSEGGVGECSLLANLDLFNPPNRLWGRCNSANLIQGPFVTDAAGHSIIGVRAAGGPIGYASKNGAAAATQGHTVTGRPNVNFAVLGLNPSSSYAPEDRWGALHFGGELDDAAIARIAARVNTYFTAVGFNTY